MKVEELGKQLCTSGWFLGSFCVRSLAALILLALMMLIASIWVRCGLALAEKFLHLCGGAVASWCRQLRL